VNRATESQRHRGQFGFALCLCVSVACFAASPAYAQVNGHVSVLFDALPDISEAPGSQRVMELRTRAFVEHKRDVSAHLRVNLSGYLDALAGDRKASGATGTAAAAIISPNDFYAEFFSTRFDVRVGASRIVWGRLDEFQPTDVVNPIDLTRFLLEGRSEARLPVGLVRARAFLPHSAAIEAIVVPVFRPGRFDQLDEPTSPFNLAANANVICPPVGLGPCRLLARERREPPVAWSNIQGGARFTATTGRVDWAVSSFRGFQAFPSYAILPPTTLVEAFPRYTMLGGDFETVRGPWGLRGEAAAFVDDGPDRIESGVGVDRRAGDYRVAGNILWTHHDTEGNDVTLVAAADRSFARETRTVRVFAVYDPADETMFVRGIGAVSLRDDVWLEGSAGIFTGTALDTLGRLTRRDFVYTRLKVFF
jgi:hypothetical protein